MPMLVRQWEDTFLVDLHLAILLSSFVCLQGTMGGPGGLTSMGPHRVGHDWSDLAAAAAVHQEVLWLKLRKQIHWRHMLWKHLGGNLFKVKVGRKRENSGSALETLFVICHSQREALLLSPSLLCLPHDRPMNWRWGVEAKNKEFIQKTGKWRRWQTNVSK